MCASNPAATSILIHSYTEQRQMYLAEQQSTETSTNNDKNRLNLGRGDRGGWLITYFSTETLRPDWRPSTGEWRKNLSKVISMEQNQQTT